MKVALLANLKRNAPTWPEMPPDRWDHLSTWPTVEAIMIALEQGGRQAIFLEGDKSLYNNLQAVQPDICFNLCQGHFGPARKAHVPAILEMLGLPYTGSRALTLAMDRALTKRLLADHDLPTPPFRILERVDEALKIDLPFPIIIRAGRDSAGLEPDPGLIAENEAALAGRLQQFFQANHQPALVETVIAGQALSVGVVGNLPAPAARSLPAEKRAPAIFQGLQILPPVETMTSEKDGGFLTARRANFEPVPLTRSQARALKWLAAAAFRVIGCLDVAVIRFRLEAQAGGRPYIVEVEPLPNLEPEKAPLSRAAETAGWSYEELINRILVEALARFRPSSPAGDALPPADPANPDEHRT